MMNFSQIRTYILSISLLISYINSSYAQNFGDKDYFLIDSLKVSDLSEADKDILNEALNKYHNAKHDSVRIQALELITENLMDDAWVKYNLMVKHLVEKNLLLNPPTTLKKKYLKSLAATINNIGVDCEQNGNLVDAILHFHKSLKIQEYLNELDAVATTLNNIGTIYNTLGNEEKTLEYLEKSLKIREEINDKNGIAQSLNNIGSILYNQKELSKALNHFERSLDLYKQVGNKEGMAYSLSNMGNIYDLMKSPKGLSYHQRSLKLREEIGDKKGQAFGLVNVSESHLLNGNLKEAYECANKALDLSKKMGFPDNIQKSAYVLSKIYKSQSKFPLALEFYELSVLMKDSIRNEESNRASYKQQAKYEFEKQQAVKDAEHNKQMEVIAERGEKQKVITYSIALGSLLLLVFFIFIYNRLQITKRQKSIIEEQKQLVEEKQKEILDSINYAKRIQAAILPSDRVIKQFLPDSFVFYKPKDIVAGDFYWMEQKNGDILFAAADCTGHGVPGAMVSVVCNNALNRSVREFGLTEPSKILDKTKEIVIQEFEKSDADVKDGMDIAICSLNGNTLYYSGANNPLWIVRKEASVIEEVKSTKQPVGKVDNTKPFENHKIELHKGDSVYIFTDGFQDQFGGEKGKKFKAAKLKELLLEVNRKSMNEQLEILAQTFDKWKGSLEQVDDVCIIGVRI
jgi:serine phosphatase RsbU (regulator of sigma subunit)